MSAQNSSDRRVRNRALRQFEAWAETPMVILSFFWLALVILELTHGVSVLIVALGTTIWLIFIAEFMVRLTLASEKAAFVKRNWLTAAALVFPAFRALAALRVLRVVRAARGLTLVRVLGTANRSMNALRKSMTRRGLGYVLALTLTVALLGATGMLNFEPAHEVEGGFRSFGDALWWTAMLLTTMGSDFWPRTLEGRILCVLLAIYGFAVWGYITATLATFFLGQEARSLRGEIAGARDIAELTEEIRALKRQLRAAGVTKSL